MAVLSAGAAGAQNIETLIVLRFLAGAAGASPMTNTGGVTADVFTASERTLAIAIFGTPIFLGPSLGPIVSGFLGQSASWRWIEGLLAALSGVTWLLYSLSVPETYAPVLLRMRAAKLSKLTGDVYISKLDMGDRHKTMAVQFKTALSRPWVLLFSEPIVFITALYMAIVYGKAGPLISATASNVPLTRPRNALYDVPRLPHCL